MATITFEISNNLERINTRLQKNPWQWKGQIILTGLTPTDRAKLSLPINSSPNDIIPMSGTIEPGKTPAEMRKVIVDQLHEKVSELKQIITPPKIDTLALPTNENCKSQLTSLEKLDAMVSPEKSNAI